jgi:hypothetical protein
MSLRRALTSTPLLLLVACSTQSDQPLGAWADVATIGDATMRAESRDAIGVGTALVFAVTASAGTEVVHFDVTTGEVRREPFTETSPDQLRRGDAATYVVDDDRPDLRTVLVEVPPHYRYVFGAHQGADGRGAAVIVRTAGSIGPIAGPPEAMPRPSGAGVIGSRPFAAGELGLHAYARDGDDWQSVDLPAGGAWSTTSVGGVAYAVGDAGGGVAIKRLDVE